MKILAQLRFQASLAVCVLFVCLFSLPAFEQESSLNRYRTADPDPLAAAAPAALVKTVTADPERKLPDLVAYLAKGSDDPFLTVKRIHDWIALNIAYDTSVPYGGKPPRQHWASVLAERKGVCSGYSELFKKMAEIAGFACDIAGGYSRGTDLDIFTDFIDVDVASTQANVEIRYTLDGSVPTVGSPLVKGPVRVTGTTVLTTRYLWRIP